MARTREKTSVLECLQKGQYSGKELQELTESSQAWVSTQIRRLGDSVVKLGQRRGAQYALTKNAFGVGDHIPLYMVDSYGNNSSVAIIKPLLHGGFYLEPLPGAPAILLGVNNDGVFRDLPYFLQDLRPQGFIGRQIALELSSRVSTFPSDPRAWNMSHVGRYLLSAGDDLPGNFQLGEAGLLRMRRKPQAHSREEYPKLADAALAGELPGSSAGGEQPKFTIYNSDEAAHVIVKFSHGGNTLTAARWRDVLISEYHAAEALHEQNFPAAELELLEYGGRVFLESKRFDRTGEYGRQSMISAQSVDGEYLGNGSDWPIVMDYLRDNRLLSDENHYDACVLWEFGYLIHNTDMHLGNLSLAMEGSVFGLVPVYDMCSMGIAPYRDQVRPINFEITSPTSPIKALKNGHAQKVAINLAYDYWERMSLDDRISQDLKNFLDKGNPMESFVSS